MGYTYYLLRLYYRVGTQFIDYRLRFLDFWIPDSRTYFSYLWHERSQVPLRIGQWHNIIWYLDACVRAMSVQILYLILGKRSITIILNTSVLCNKIKIQWNFYQSIYFFNVRIKLIKNTIYKYNTNDIFLISINLCVYPNMSFLSNICYVSKII